MEWSEEEKKKNVEMDQLQMKLVLFSLLLAFWMAKEVTLPRVSSLDQDIEVRSCFERGKGNLPSLPFHIQRAYLRKKSDLGNASS